MSGRKKQTIIYKGLGFPIKLIDVPMKKMFGDWVIDIDMTELQLVVLRDLLYKPLRLTKDELKLSQSFLLEHYFVELALKTEKSITKLSEEIEKLTEK